MAAMVKAGLLTWESAMNRFPILTATLGITASLLVNCQDTDPPAKGDLGSPSDGSRTRDGRITDVMRGDGVPPPGVDSWINPPGDGPNTPPGDGPNTPPGDAWISPDSNIASLPRGLRWVRTHPMFISGLVVGMGPPPASSVNEYFDVFKANAIHLWSDGLPTEMNVWRSIRPAAPWVSWVMADGRSADNVQVAGGYSPNTSGRIGYQIGDEPQNMADLLEMEAGVNAVRAVDPEALIYVNFNDKATTQMLDHYNTMDSDVISYDRYSRGYSSYRERAQIRSYGLMAKRPYWRYINAYYTASDPLEITESDMRWDAFSGLVFGYTGHTWFVYKASTSHDPRSALFDTHASFTAAKSSLFPVATQINTELLNLGRCITQLTSTDVRYVASNVIVEVLMSTHGVGKWSPGAGNDPFITSIAAAPGQGLLEFSVGFFLDDAGEQYIMVQNTCHSHADIPINNSNAGTVRIEFDFSSAGAHIARDKVLTLDKLTGAQQSLPLTGIGGTKAQLDVHLAAGDPILFKYATGQPIRLGP